MTLQPIALELQIEHAIRGADAETLRLTGEKIAIIHRDVEKVFAVNGKKVYDVALVGDEIYFTFRRGAKTRYHYPAQYALVELAN